MKHKSITVNAFLNSVRSILNIIFPLITFPYISRKLTVGGIGIYNFSSSIISYFLLLAGLGINTYAVREGAKYRNDKNKITKFSSEVFTINICSTIISYLILFACLILFSKLRNYILCIMIFSLQIIFTTIGTEWIYQIYEDYSFITIRSVIFQIISIILLFCFVRGPKDYLNYATITVFSSVGSNILNFICARKYHIHLVFNFDWKKHIIPILILFAVNITTSIYVSSDITLLGILRNNYDVGIYSISSKIYQMVKTLISALLIVTIPRLAMLYGNNRTKEYNIILSRLTNTLITLSLPASTGLFMLSKEVIYIVSGPHYFKAISSLRILCFSYIFSVLAWILSDCVLIPAKREKYMLRSTTFSAIINIVFNLILIPFYSENAAAFSTVLAEITMFIVNYHYTKDMVNTIFISKYFWRNFVSSLLGCVGIIIVCVLCNIGWQSLILKTAFSIVLSIIIYGAILVLLRNEIALNMLSKLKIIMHKL